MIEYKGLSGNTIRIDVDEVNENVRINGILFSWKVFESFANASQEKLYNFSREREAITIIERQEVEAENEKR